MHKTAYGKKLSKAKLIIIADQDGTLIDWKKSDGLREFRQWIIDHKDKVVFGVASGRNKRQE